MFVIVSAIGFRGRGTTRAGAVGVGLVSWPERRSWASLGWLWLVLLPHVRRPVWLASWARSLLWVVRACCWPMVHAVVAAAVRGRRGARSAPHSTYHAVHVLEPCRRVESVARPQKRWDAPLPCLVPLAAMESPARVRSLRVKRVAPMPHVRQSRAHAHVAAGDLSWPS